MPLRDMEFTGCTGCTAFLYRGGF
ncbi:unnamed protein product [Linum tenue]|uniref:Uncharacterized protein n=1 Tax=Linum tenue TaxID=586396 RepID=A0AAV0J8M3_9ROSI|nr:unnamed protein product [Linum tenue]